VGPDDWMDTAPHRVRSLQSLAEEKTQRRRVQADRADAQFPLLEQVNLIGTDVAFTQLI